jgi:hypothetical protein
MRFADGVDRSAAFSTHLGEWLPAVEDGSE